MPTSALEADFARFCQDHPIRSLEIDGVTWQYRIAGAGRQGLLLLPGAVGGSEPYFGLVPLLGTTHRLVFVTYPPAQNLGRLLDGLAAILDSEGLASTDLVGGSFGGLVAQAFLRRFPLRTRRVVLSATGAADPMRADNARRWQRFFEALPIGCSRAWLRLIVRVSLRRVREGRGLWRDFYRRAIDALSRADIGGRYGITAELCRLGPPTPADLTRWTGEIFVVEGAADAIANERARTALKAVYPLARVHSFDGGGHAVALERPRDWAVVVSIFLVS